MMSVDEVFGISLYQQSPSNTVQIWSALLDAAVRILHVLVRQLNLR